MLVNGWYTKHFLKTAERLTLCARPMWFSFWWGDEWTTQKQNISTYNIKKYLYMIYFVYKSPFYENSSWHPVSFFLRKGHKKTTNLTLQIAGSPDQVLLTVAPKVFTLQTKQSGFFPNTLRCSPVCCIDFPLETKAMMEKTCGMKNPFVFWKASMNMFPFFVWDERWRPWSSFGFLRA